MEPAVTAEPESLAESAAQVPLVAMAEPPLLVMPVQTVTMDLPLLLLPMALTAAMVTTVTMEPTVTMAVTVLQSQTVQMP